MQKTLITRCMVMVGFLAFVLNAQADYTDDCITFSSAASFTLKVDNASKNWDGTLWTSIDKINWTEWNGAEVVSMQTGDAYSLYVRGNSSNTKITGMYWGGQWVLAGPTNITCSGNIETLRGATDNLPSPTEMASYCYAYLFYDCTALTAAPMLPATTLSSSCYQYMFCGCTSLETAPALPAMTMTTLCYGEMFSGCTMLTSSPDLPAMMLAEACYYSMFENCTSLTNIPALLATALAKECYACMFYGCASLEVNVDAPGLEWRIPVSSTTAVSWGEGMLSGTAGTLQGQPTTGTTYYIAHTHLPAGGPYREMVDGIEWTYSIVGGGAVLGSDHDDLIRAVSRDMSGGMQIPGVLGSCPTVGIGRSAFGGCTNISSITVPNTVHTISDKAFFGCSNLVNVTLNEGLSNLCYSAFAHCSRLSAVTLPSTLIEIGQCAFVGCDTLKDLYFMGDVPTIQYIDDREVERPYLDLDYSGVSAASWHLYYNRTDAEKRYGLRVDDLTAMYSYLPMVWNEEKQIHEYGDTVEIARNYQVAKTIFGLLARQYASSSSAYDSHSYWPTFDKKIHVTGKWRSLPTSNHGDMNPYYYRGYGVWELCSVVQDGWHVESTGENSITVFGSFPRPEGVISIPAEINGKVVSSVSIRRHWGVDYLDSDENECNRGWGGVTDLVLAEGISNINECAFCRCNNLKSASFPSTLQTISPAAFKYCSSLSTMTFCGVPSSVSPSSFSGCDVAVVYAPAENLTALRETLSQALPVDNIEFRTYGIAPMAVDAAWLDDHNDLLRRHGMNYERAFCAESGKIGPNGEKHYVWQDYVVGTDPEDSNSVFRVDISMENGIPKLAWNPNLNSNSVERIYTVFGKTNLFDDVWHTPTNEMTRFFKVGVVLTNSDSMIGLGNSDESGGGSPVYTCNGYVRETDSVVFNGLRIGDVMAISGEMGGAWIENGKESLAATCCNMKTTWEGLSVQFQVLHGWTVKCVCVLFSQHGDDVYAHVKYVKYSEDSAVRIGFDFDTIQSGPLDVKIATSDTDPGYGIKNLKVSCREWRLEAARGVRRR